MTKPRRRRGFLRSGARTVTCGTGAVRLALEENRTRLVSIPRIPAQEVRIRAPRHRVARRAITWWMLRALLVWTAPIVALAAGYLLVEPARAWLIAAMLAVGVLTGVAILVEPFWRYRVHRWEVTDRAIYAAGGWLVREWRVAPMSRIQTVDALRGPLEQLLGLATLRVTTASAQGAIVVPGLDHVTARETAHRLAMAAQITAGDAT